MKPAFRIAAIGASALVAIGLSMAGPAMLTVATGFVQQLQPGDSLAVSCPSVFVAAGLDTQTATIACATLTPTSTPTATNTPVPPTNTALPTNTAVPPTNTPVPAGDGAIGNSHAMGLWTPTTRDTCTKAEHDAFYVIAPDGLRYPTWHPPVLTRANGTTCTFGHEHGQNPATSLDWPQTRAHYAPPNGDLARAGVPFGYMSEQMDKWITATGAAMPMRHEDHVGHKVAIANNFKIGLDRGNGTGQFFSTKTTCSYVVAYHQGTHSRDAFENNLHQVLYNVDCADGHGVHLDVMGRFGKVGEFTRFCDVNGTRQTAFTVTGTDYASPAFPGARADGDRLIVDRACVQQIFLVAPPAWSANPYEAWPVQFGISRANGAPIVDGLNLLFDVEDAIRYYWPGHASTAGGILDNLGHFQDLCIENFNGRTFRGGVCDQGTRSAAWDSPSAGFKGVNRGVYFKPSVTHNAGGPTVWYTDPFGRNAQTSPFPGSVKQLVSSDARNYAAMEGPGVNETANVINMRHVSTGVHAPN